MAKISNIKRERFESVASRRVQKVLDDLDSLAKCSNKNTYQYSDEDVRRMMKAINEKVALLKISFTAGSKTSKQTFEF